MMGIIDTFCQANWQIIFMSTAGPSDMAADLSSMGVATETVQLNCRRFDERIAQLRPDVVIFDRFMVEEQFSARVYQACPQAMRILNTEDLHSVRHARQQSVKTGDTLPTAKAPCHSDIHYREIAAILRCDLTLVISQNEYQLLHEVYQVPQSQLLLLPLLTGIPPIAQKHFEEKEGFVFIGNFRHPPNWDAVVQLQKIWPHIQRKIADAKLHIYGAYPPKKAMVLHNPKKGFYVHGWAKDATSTVNAHRVMLAPLRFGAGIKGKLVLAMRCGTPSVTSPLGSEGIVPYRTMWPGIVADNESAFVEGAVALYQDKAQWEKARQWGNELVEQQFDDQKHKQVLLGRVKSDLLNIESMRQQHFAQGMLWHHSLRATQYMSQWIEAKNRPGMKETPLTTDEDERNKGDE
ncbi:glycosyltransferase family 4 protein [Alteromonas sp. C1M14]|nr:glycosyltransferase family 4 protein [Alteromonas sp. C1M14]